MGYACTHINENLIDLLQILRGTRTMLNYLAHTYIHTYVRICGDHTLSTLL